MTVLSTVYRDGRRGPLPFRSIELKPKSLDHVVKFGASVCVVGTRGTPTNVLNPSPCPDIKVQHMRERRQQVHLRWQ